MQGAIGCSDPRGCPDLVVPLKVLATGMLLENVRFPTHSCTVEEGLIRAGSRRILRFNTASFNLGDGSLVIGDPHNYPDLYSFNNCHGHPHFEDYGAYRLWEPGAYAQWSQIRESNPDALSRDLLAANPQLTRHMTSGNKLGFCLLDAVPCQPGLGCPEGQPIDPPTYGGVPGGENTCQTHQGIDVGWADIYIITQLGQWVEVPPAGGTFVLENEINTGRGIVEKSYTNNRAAVCVNIPPVGRGNGSYAPDPSCVTPTAMDGLNDCQMCQFTCESFGIPQDLCLCMPVYCL